MRKIRKVEGLGSFFLSCGYLTEGFHRLFSPCKRVLVGLEAHHEQYLVLCRFARKGLTATGAWLWIPKCFGVGLSLFVCDLVISKLEEGFQQVLEEEDGAKAFKAQGRRQVSQMKYPATRDLGGTEYQVHDFLLGQSQ